MEVNESAQAGSSSSYHSPPVAFENDIPLPVQVEVTVERPVGALIPIPEDEDIEDVFRQVEDERREFERDAPLEIEQREQDAEDVRLGIRRAPVVRNTKPSYQMSTGVVLGSGVSKIAKPKRFDGSRGDLRGNRSRRNRKYMDRVNHEFSKGQSRKQRASLVEIVSQITRRSESALVIPEGNLLRRAVESLLLANPRGTSGRLVETAVGPNSSWRLELTVPLSDEDGETWMALLVPDRADSPQWERGSHNEESF